MPVIGRGGSIPLSDTTECGFDERKQQTSLGHVPMIALPKLRATKRRFVNSFQTYSTAAELLLSCERAHCRDPLALLGATATTRSAAGCYELVTRQLS